ncbi:MAG: hypothetical protein ACQEQY_03895, partial [Halobacteriota archaeon]
MGRVLVVGVVVVMLGAAIATPGAVVAGGDSDGGLDAIEYSVNGIGAISPAPNVLALSGDDTLSDEDDVDDEDDED